MLLELKTKARKGFTLIELLVVIAIIGILSSVVLVSLNDARHRAKIAAAEADLVNIRTGIIMLVHDTGKGPNGCIYGRTADPEVWLSARQAGLIERPVAGTTTSASCQWTSEDVSRWQGPYIQTGVDPWGTSYRFDPDYVVYDNCKDKKPEKRIVVQAIVSGGPDKNTGYTCDDIWITLK